MPLGRPEEANSLAFLNSTRNSVDAHPDAHACRLKISLVMLDSPISPPWDTSLEMAEYVRKLPHVSANCRLTPQEELTLLGICICDPADRRFEPERHTVHSVLLCKNRRSALREALTASSSLASAGSTVECDVEVPPRHSPFNWICTWSSALADGVSDDQISSLLAELAMKYQHQRCIQLDSMLGYCHAFNTRTGKGAPASATIASGAFLLLYNLFQGGTQARVSHANCSASFATLLLSFFHAELHEGPNILSALLLTLARVPELGPFLPAFTDDRKHKRRDVLTGLPLPDEETAPLGALITAAVKEISELGSAEARRHEEVARVMLGRRVDTLTKERMWSGFGGGGGLWGGGGGGWAGGGWGSGGWGGCSSWGGSGACAGQSSYQRLEQLAVETEEQCAAELAAASQWRQIPQQIAARMESPRQWAGPPATCRIGLCTASLPPAQVSDHGCAEREVRGVPKCGVEALRVLCTAPLEAATTRWCTRLGRAEQGQLPIDASLGFDVSAHPEAASKVALDMQVRLATDAEEFADQLNCSSACRLTFMVHADEIVRDGAARAAAEASLRELIQELAQQRERDAAFVGQTLPALLKRANTVPLDDGPRLDPAARTERELFVVRQLAMQEAVVSADYLLCLLISSKGTDDLRSTNPFITPEAALRIFDELIAVVLHANRIGHINRCLSEAHGLLSLLRPRGDGFGSSEAVRTEAASALTLKAQSLAEQMLVRRHYVEPTSRDRAGGDLDPSATGLACDPRFLLFEFTHNLVLRKAQVELVREFVGAVKAGRPLVKQMLMGGGVPRRPGGWPPSNAPPL